MAEEVEDGREYSGAREWPSVIADNDTNSGAIGDKLVERWRTQWRRQSSPQCRLLIVKALAIGRLHYVCLVRQLNIEVLAAIWKTQVHLNGPPRPSRESS